MKNGDNAATYPPLMSVAGMPEADERIVNEAAGFIWRASTLSAAHMTDYLVDMGTWMLIGGGRTQLLLKLCERAGLVTKAKDQTGLTSYKIIADPEFIHMRLREEILWERQQRNDTGNPAIAAPVRQRDGDTCRWCGVLVQWMGRGDSSRRATLDHLVPGRAGTIDTMVVACKGCNSGRGADTAAWDSRHDLRQPPAKPLYGEATAAYLRKHGHPDAIANVTSDEKPARAEASQAAAHTQRQGTSAAQATGAGRPAMHAPKVPSKVPAKSTLKSLSQSERTTSSGTGRDGNGLAGTSRDRTERVGSGMTQGPPPAWAGVTWPDAGTERAGTAVSETPGRRKRSRGKRGGRGKAGKSNARS